MDKIAPRTQQERVYGRLRRAIELDIAEGPGGIGQAELDAVTAAAEVDL